MKRKLVMWSFLLVLCLVGVMACTQKKEESPNVAVEESPDVAVKESPDITMDQSKKTEGNDLYPEWTDASIKAYTIGLVKDPEVDADSDDQYDYIYSEEFQTSCDEGIGLKKQEGTYSLEAPLAILNPYGTLTNSLYLYFTTDKECEIEYTIQVDGEPEFTRTLFNGMGENQTKEHEYTLIGFVRNRTNTVNLRAKDKEGKVLQETSFTIGMPDYYTKPIPAIKVTKGTSSVSPSEGLYALLGFEMRESSKTILVDNEGVLRAEMLLDAYRMDTIEKIGDKILYPNAFNEFVVMNRLGKLERFYSFDKAKYEQHHDFIYDEANESLLILANDKQSDSIEDVVLAMDLKTGETKVVLNFKTLLKEEYDKAALYTGKNVYGGEEVDWIHLNSISLLPDGTVIFSSRELNSVIAIENIYTKPAIKYIIGNRLVWEGTPYIDLVYTKVGEFVDSAGQHTANYAGNEGVGEGEYYINLYNNNYLTIKAREELQNKLRASGEFPGVGLNEKELAANHSYYYKYLVNEKDKTYTLVTKIPVDYSAIVSSSQDFAGNVVVNSGRYGSVAEYDSKGKLIVHLQYEVDRHCYRAFKFDFDGFWFQK